MRGLANRVRPTDSSRHHFAGASLGHCCARWRVDKMGRRCVRTRLMPAAKAYRLPATATASRKGIVSCPLRRAPRCAPTDRPQRPTRIDLRHETAPAIGVRHARHCPRSAFVQLDDIRSRPRATPSCIASPYHHRIISVGGADVCFVLGRPTRARRSSSTSVSFSSSSRAPRSNVSRRSVRAACALSNAALTIARTA